MAPSKFSRKCFMCNSKQPRNGRADCSFHRFPSGPSTRAEWIRFCRLSNDDDVSKLHLCSKHFTPDNYVNNVGKEMGGYVKLRPGAIPTICNPHRLQVQHTRTTPSSEEVRDTEIRTETIRCMEEPSSEEARVTEIRTETIQCMEEPSSEEVRDTEIRTETIPCMEEPLPLENAEVEEAENIGPSTPKKRRFAEPRYIGEIKTPDVATPRRAKRNLRVAIQTVQKYIKKVRALQEQRRYLKKKLNSLKDLIIHLKDKNLISEQTADSLMEGLPESVKQIILRTRGHKRKYLPELRSFAITLQFYSSKAYNYVRRVLGKALPHPATLRGWYTVVNGAPGFSKEAFEAIRRKEDPVCNIVIDDMSIKEQMLFANGKFYGGVDLGVGLDSSVDNTELAKNAMVFMAVALNNSWKIPLGYFLIKGLPADERGNLLSQCLNLMHDAKAIVHSVTFDGAAVNISMCKKLGANFDYGEESFKPFIVHPQSKHKIFIFFDMCHMIKLIRNALGDMGSLYDGEGQKIAWEFIKQLEALQNESGLTAATKLSKSHINYNDNRMKVKLAVQTLSESVSNALKFVHSLNYDKFQGCEATAQFCFNINNAFDILNCKNVFSKDRFRIPLNEVNYTKLNTEATRLIGYIEQLKDNTGTPILQSKRKTGFLGVIICLTNIFHLYETLVTKGALRYLLTFKLSQDFLETFFSAIRARGGWNNNPNAFQFRTAYKRLLLRHDIRDFDNSNCLADHIEILGVGSTKPKRRHVDSVALLEDEYVATDFDHDYINTLWSLSSFIRNVVAYIGGFVVSKLLKKQICTICSAHLTSQDAPLLIAIKNRGPLINPSKEVIRICTVAEKVLRENTLILFNTPNIIDKLITKIINRLGVTFDTESMQEHILSQHVVDNHKIQLLKLILQTYLTVRLHHEGRVRSQKDCNVRHKYTKLILFHNQ